MARYLIKNYIALADEVGVRWNKGVVMNWENIIKENEKIIEDEKKRRKVLTRAQQWTVWVYEHDKNIKKEKVR